jgi:very-short-patch-repair endonuclease
VGHPLTRIDARSAARLLGEPGVQSEGEATLAAQLRMLKAPPPVAEYRFEQARQWRFDFAWPEFMVAVEVEGGHWIRGAGSHGGGRFESDCAKYNEAAILGWLVLRFTTDMVMDGRAVQAITRALWTKGGRLK